VTRLLGDHGENQKAQFAVIEQPAAVSFAVMSFAVMMSVMSPAAVISDLVVGMAMGVVSMMMIFHSSDIDRDISKVKIYLILRSTTRIFGGPFGAIRQLKSGTTDECGSMI
jgi:hypothetical protein